MMTAKIEGQDLVIRIRMGAPRPSASGKTLVVATSGGNQRTEAMVDGKAIVVGLNAYIPRN